MAEIGSLKLTNKDVMQGVTLTVRMPRSLTLRTSVACWLLGLAGRVIDVPCRLALVHDGEEI